jgi:hypothetical protein
MTVVESNMPSQPLHARHAAIIRREKSAAARFDKLDDKRMALLRSGVPDDEAVPDGYAEAESVYDEAFQERWDLEQQWLAAAIESKRDVVGKVRIIVSRGELFSESAVDDLIEQFADQVMAFAKSRHS